MDFDFDGSKKSQAKTGRRAKRNATSMNTNERQLSTAESVASVEDISNQGPNSPPKPSRRMAGWGDTGTGGRRKEKVAEDSRLVVTGDSPRTRIYSSGEDDNDDIQVIPDLDDVHVRNYCTVFFIWVKSGYIKAVVPNRFLIAYHLEV